MLRALNNLKEMLEVEIDPSIEAIDTNYLPGSDKYSPYNLSDSFSSLLMMNGLLVANIWKHKTGQSQTVTVDHERAMEMLYRPNFIHINDQPLSLDAFKRFESLTHKTKDGYFETTTALVHLHDKTLNVLNCPPNKEAIEAAYLSKTAEEWETIFNAHGLSGAKVRTQEEFRKHPQGQFLSQLPPVQVKKLGQGTPRPFKPSERPLSDVKVLDVSHIIAGPSMSTFLAEQGAEVLHIANPKAERVKSNYLDTGFGKKNAYLDFNVDSDLNRFYELIKETDVYVNGYAPGRLQEKFGITEEKLLSLNPDLIIVTSSAFGEVGPWSKRHGWENIAQAAVGSAFDHGTLNQPTLCPYGFITDYGTGLMGAMGILKALHNRAFIGGAQHVSVSLAATCIWYQDQQTGTSEKDVEAMHKIIAKVVSGGNKSQFTTTTQTPYGEMTHLKPVLEYSETPAYWARPTSPLGSDKPEWD
ncbi:CoA transferase [Vibrio mediterranei]|uniref:CoA transferase n=1 Tax=Vibrio mediterranei TaxID=689 RepID=UPI001EFE729C|nr:CoA transferase [Vibrio mediterranei]MCG9627424.1 CoA transferase [Vibrio mediterranei]